LDGDVIEHFTRPDGLGPANGYSHATAATGRVVAVSGQLPVDGDGRLVGDDPLAQARQVFANITTALRAAGAGPADVLRLNFYVLDLADLAAVRQARDEFVTDPPPASSLIQVAGLVLPGARLEIDALALTQ
jgi:enamine deaminase RidA (YjgF/YER057c/UK114 family)